MKEIIAFIAFMVVAVAIAYWVFLHIPSKRWISEYSKNFSHLSSNTERALFHSQKRPFVEDRLH